MSLVYTKKMIVLSELISAGDRDMRIRTLSKRQGMLLSSEI